MCLAQLTRPPVNRAVFLSPQETPTLKIRSRLKHNQLLQEKREKFLPDLFALRTLTLVDDLPLLNTPTDAKGFNWRHGERNEAKQTHINGTDREAVFTDISRRESMQECEPIEAGMFLSFFTRNLLILFFTRCRRNMHCNIGVRFHDSALDAFPCSTLA
jgi:hypothetical protein